MTAPRMAAYMHIDGFDTFEKEVFNRRQVRAGFRAAGRLVTGRAQMNLALAKGQDGYPVKRTGTLIDSIRFRVSRSGFMVKIMPEKTPGMAAYYPAYLHYGVKQGRRVKALEAGKGKGRSNRRGVGQRAEEMAARAAGGWRISPRDNYIADALDDSSPRVRAILSSAFARAMR